MEPAIDPSTRSISPPVVRIAYDANSDLKDQRVYIFQVQKVGDELQFVQVPQQNFGHGLHGIHGFDRSRGFSR